MSFTKTIGTLIVTALLGAFAVVFTAPKKVLKNKVKPTNSSTDWGREEREDLFI